MRLRPFLRMFTRMFRVEAGLVIAVNAPAAPATPPEPPAPPREETREERNARLDALLAASRERGGGARAGREGGEVAGEAGGDERRVRRASSLSAAGRGPSWRAETGKGED